MKHTTGIFLVISAIFSGSCTISSQSLKPYTEDEKTIASEMEDVLVNNILHVYYPRIIDTVNGGFFTNFDNKWNAAEPKQQKMLVTQSRDIWTACQAATRYPDDTRFKKAAEHGFKYLRDVMWDKTYGGFYNYKGMDEQKNPSVKLKMAYGNAFAIYALSAWYKLSHSAEALELAEKDFLWLENNSHDPVYGGYYNVMSQEGYSVINPKMDSKSKIFLRLNGKYKDYNSSIHLMEAFTSLYEVWPDDLVKKRLEEMFLIVRDKKTAPK
jgi:mannobiose 2-epimerase